MTNPTAISIKDELKKLKFLSNRTPTTTSEEAKDAFATLARYGDGGIFIAYYAGNSEWERHVSADEIVLVLEGETNLILLSRGEEIPNPLREGEFLIVPKNIWHRFETTKSVKIFSVTPQPTEHSIEKPKL